MHRCTPRTRVALDASALVRARPVCLGYPRASGRSLVRPRRDHPDGSRIVTSSWRTFVVGYHPLLRGPALCRRQNLGQPPVRLYNGRGARDPVPYRVQHQHKRPGGQPMYLKMVIAIPVLGVVVYIYNLEPAPYTGRYRSIVVSKEAEKRMGDMAKRSILQQFRGQILPPTHKVVKLVQRTGSRLVRAANMENADWEFYVVEADDIFNAFATPGGKVVVFTGLKQAVGTEDELAAVLGHEIAHVVARHSAERMTFYTFLELGLVSLALMGFPVDHLTIALSRLIFELPNSRTHELEADEIGQILMATACYNPAAAAKVFEQLQRLAERTGGGNIPSFLSTHPSNEDRIRKLRARVPKAMEIYESKGCARFTKHLFEAPEEQYVTGDDPYGGLSSKGF